MTGPEKEIDVILNQLDRDFTNQDDVVKRITEYIRKHVDEAKMELCDRYDNAEKVQLAAEIRELDRRERTDGQRGGT